MFNHIPDEILIGAGAGIGLLVLVIILVIVFAAGGGRKKKVMKKWAQYARENHLTLTGEYPVLQLEGGDKGINVRFWQEVKTGDGGDDGETTAQVVSEAAVSIPAEIGDLSLAREGFFAKFGRVFGGQDIKLNDTQFDTAFIVKHSNSKRVFQILTPPVRDALIAAQQKLPDLEVSDGMVRLRGAGSTDIQRVDFVLSTLIRVATAFTSVS